MKLKIKIHRLTVIFLGIITLTGIASIRIKTNKPPLQETLLAGKMLSEAQRSNSPEYAEEDYLKASAYYDSAMHEWSRENERFILLRNYGRVICLANKSQEISRKAINEAGRNVAEVEDILQTRITATGKRMKDFDSDYGNFPINDLERQEIIESDLLYSEGVSAYSNRNYTVCTARLDSAESIINRVYPLHIEKYNAYLNGYPEWLEMVGQTISYSEKNKAYAIIIDKLARECILYKEGTIVEKYTVELGVNWTGDKKQQGDRRTPEGYYRITGKKSNGQTRFYKALLLDYPNDEDKKRFIQYKKDGLVSAGADIGYLIEIHGHGGIGTDWTEGCIALRDEDMDVIFNICPVGTKVTIVGTTKSFNDFKENKK